MSSKVKSEDQRELEELSERARKLDKAALGEIYDRFSPGMHRYAMRMLGNQQLAEDCLAEVFSRFLRAIHGGGGPRSNLRAYLYRMAHNWITDYYRRQPYLPLDTEIASEPESEPHSEVAKQMEQERVRRALSHLQPQERQVIVLKFLEGWGDSEIAEVLEKDIAEVKSLESSALAALERLLSYERG